MDYSVATGKEFSRAAKGEHAYGRLFLRPLPLSCICHVAGLGGAWLLFNWGYVPAEPVKPVAAIQVEMVAAAETGSGADGQTHSAMPAIRAPQPAVMNSTFQQVVAGESPWTAASPAQAGAAGQAGGSALAAGSGTTGAGSRETGAQSGTGGGEAAGETASAETAPAESLASIASRFAAQVEANKEYPYMAVKRGDTGVASVTVTLSAGGSLESYYISGSSGASLLDNAALQAVRAACPFAHGAGRSITLTVPIHFDLQ